MSRCRRDEEASANEQRHQFYYNWIVSSHKGGQRVIAFISFRQISVGDMQHVATAALYINNCDGCVSMTVFISFWGGAGKIKMIFVK